MGRTFRMDGFDYEIVGVSGERFTGTETGTFTDVFVPTSPLASRCVPCRWCWPER
jgi:hypothetical protein